MQGDDVTTLHSDVKLASRLRAACITPTDAIVCQPHALSRTCRAPYSHYKTLAGDSVLCPLADGVIHQAPCLCLLCIHVVVPVKSLGCADEVCVEALCQVVGKRYEMQKHMAVSRGTSMQECKLHHRVPMLCP